MKKISCALAALVPSRLQRLQSRALRVLASASAATEIIIATATTIAAHVLSFTNGIAGCIAAGTIMMATEG